MDTGVKITVLSFAGLLLVAILLLAGVSLGSVYLGFSDVVSIVFSKNSSASINEVIVWQSRIPRSCTAFLAGAGLAVAGVLMQTLFRNPLAGPSVLGISSGAGLAVAFLILGGGSMYLSQFSILVAAIFGSAVVLIIIMLVARRINDITTVLIVGLMLSYFASAGVSILQLFGSNTALRQYVFWGFGSFSDVSLSSLAAFAPLVLLTVAASFLLIKPLNALLLGEDYAGSLGVNLKVSRNSILITTGILTGTITAFCGPIAFIGIAAPHLTRAVFNTTNHKVILPFSALMGAVVAMVCDIIARLPGSDSALPLNAVCCLFGAPVVVYLIFKGNRKKSLI